jgi:hypothetical protein
VTSGGVDAVGVWKLQFGSAFVLEIGTLKLFDAVMIESTQMTFMMHQKPPQDAELVLPPLKPVVLFAGAGLSVDPPTSAPVWKDVQRRLISVVVSHLQKEDWPCVPELLEHCATLTDGLRPETFFQAFHERCAYFDTHALLKHLIGTEPNRHHFAVAEMLRTRHIAAVVTTNFDENIEQAILLASGRPARCCVSEIDYEANAADQADVYKLHGTIVSPNDICDTIPDRNPATSEGAGPQVFVD